MLPIPTEGRLILPRSVRQMTIFFPKTSMKLYAYVKHFRLDQPKNAQQATYLEQNLTKQVLEKSQ